jgi:pimeloyl-ACP methyl ester carboxylesterase
VRLFLDSGRRVAVYRTSTGTAWFPARGGTKERVVVLCHSAPGAGSFDPDPLTTRAKNVRLISVDRPGYGGSHPIASGEWATVASAADDLAAVLESLLAEPVGVAGWCAGGRVALALAARRPDLVDRVVVVGTPAPDDEVPWIAAEQREELEQLRGQAPDEVHAELGARLDSVVPEDPHAPAALWLLGAGVADEDVLQRDGVRVRLGELLRQSFVQGAHGLAADIAGYCLQPWGFEPEAVEAKTLLLYGSRDPLAGPEHGLWWKSRLPDARLEIEPRAGHLLVVPTWARALAHLSPDPPRLHLIDGRNKGTTTDSVEEFSAA